MAAHTAAFQLVLLAAAPLGCGGDEGDAPGRFDRALAPDVLFLVKNEVFGIKLDGSARRSYGTVGNDRHVAGYPRLLADGRISVLAAESGAVREWVSDGDRSFRKVGDQPSWVGDGACGAMVDGAPAIVYFASHVDADTGVSTLAMRASSDGATSEALGSTTAAALVDPAPDGADHVLAVHMRVDGADQIWRIDVRAGVGDPLGSAVVVATVPLPAYASSPMRLADGRLVVLTRDGRDVADPGQLEVLAPDGSLAPTGVVGVRAALAVGDSIVYEAGGASGVADLVVTDLRSPPRNLTNTQFISEHLGWDTER